jgi:hypothetical protein
MYIIYLLIGIAGFIFWLIFDWQKDKSSIELAFKKYLLKYVIVAAAPFIAGLVLEWVYLRYAIAAGLTVIAGLFINVVIGWFKALKSKL